MRLNKDKDKLYTRHGKKCTQGKLAEINGQKALAYFEGQEIVGYTTMDELLNELHSRKLQQYELNF